MRSAGRYVVIAALGCALAPAASATTIGFTGLINQAGSTFVSDTEAGFQVVSTSGSWIIDGYGDPSPSIIVIDPSAGPASSPQIAVTRSGGDFTFSSIGLYSSVTTIPYTFVGLLGGQVAFTTSGVVPNTFGNFKTVSNSFSTNVIDTLDVVLPTQVNSFDNPRGLDNIVVNPVPEPASLVCLGVALLGMVMVRWRRPTVGP